MSQSSPETLLLKQPSVSAEEVTFLYAGDIWIARRDGSYPRRLTAQKGRKMSPYFSPDGEWIAFSANYDGNISAYVINREGGSPRRLTYHPYEDLVRGWTPDGQQVLFASARDSTSYRYRKLFSVALDHGFPSALPMPMAERGSFSPDAKRLAYTPYFEAFWSWKRYRGGMTLPIWLLDMATFDHIEIPHENASDTFPCWVGDSVYFLSDRSQTMNVFRYDVITQAVEQITFHTDFDVRSLTAGSGVLAYEQAGRVHLYDPAVHQAVSLTISIAADLPYTRPNYQKLDRFVQNAGISPTGLRAVVEARGEIFTLPAKKGEIRNLTRSSGVAERYPAWSPDGQSIAYFSDAGGEYDLVISDQKGSQKTIIPLDKVPAGRTFFYSPIWSPDGKKIAFSDKALHLYTLDLESRAATCVDTEPYDHPDRGLNPAWSPDSQWLAYTRRLDNQIRAVFLYELAVGKPVQVTDGMSDAADACFSRDGKYLFFAASSDFGLNTGWLDMSSFERPVTRSLYVIVLNKEDPSPLAPESDEEKPAGEKKLEDKASAPDGSAGHAAAQPAETGPADGQNGGSKPADAERKPEPVRVKIDLEGIDQRILALPVPARDYNHLQSAENKLFYLEFLPGQLLLTGQPSLTLHAYDLKERKSEVFVEKVAPRSYWVSADGKKLLYRAPGSPARFAIVAVDKKLGADEGALNLDGLEMLVDPRAEWRQIFREAFRIHRDFFYDAHLHGLDLAAAYQKYLPFLDHVGHRDDLNYLLAEFSGELVVGHAYVGAGDIPSADEVPVGLLGADVDLVEGGYYRIRRILPGINWHPELRAPLTEPGVNVKQGEYILAVNGRPLRAPANFFAAFEKTADRITEILVGPTPQASEARTVTVRPVASDTALRHWDWVEGNRKQVDQLSNGRVAYVYMPDTGIGGYTSFNRYYFSQLNKSGVVLDERFNGGGSVADYVVDLLNRSLLSYWATRDGKEFSTPNASIIGPKVMIINEHAGSGGDAMPLFFRRRGLGKLVGKRTWGGLIGIYDYPLLLDGGFFTSPRMAIFSPQGEWEVENVGISPDIEVEMTPKQVIAGHDPQLEKAVAVVLAELDANPPVKVRRPAPANKV